MAENGLVTFIGILVVAFTIMAGCAAFEEVQELMGFEPTQDAVDGPNELEKAGATGKSIGDLIPPPAGGWVTWAAAALGGLGVLLKQKRTNKKKLDEKEIDVLTAKADADISDHRRIAAEEDLDAATEATVAVNAMRESNAQGNANFSTHNKTVLDEILSDEAKAFIASAKALANGDIVAKFNDK